MVLLDDILRTSILYYSVLNSGYISESSTDFIFTVIGEELGFLGCLFLLFLYFVLIYRALLTAKECKEPFGMLLVTGIVAMWTFEILVNVGMTCGRQS